MTFPAPHSVTHVAVAGWTEDDLGNTLNTYAAPVTCQAIGIAPHNTELWTDITSAVVADVDMSMPPTTVNMKDRFTIGATTYEVVGVQDFNTGFVAWTPGIMVALQKVI